MIEFAPESARVPKSPQGEATGLVAKARIVAMYTVSFAGSETPPPVITMLTLLGSSASSEHVATPATWFTQPVPPTD
jgi:hypothetical protein